MLDILGERAHYVGFVNSAASLLGQCDRFFQNAFFKRQCTVILFDNDRGCVSFRFTTGFFFGRVFGKLRFRLCRNLEFLSWVLSFFLELLSFFLNYFEKQPIFHNKLTILQYFSLKLGIVAMLQPFKYIFPFSWVKNFNYVLELCGNLEFFAWV